MRKFNNIWLTFIAVVWMFGCAEDKGNYDYKTLNAVEISGFKPATDNNGVYSLLKGQRLTIRPTITQTQGEVKDLTFLWLIDKDTVGRSNEIDYEIPETMSFGEKLGRLIVTDMRTNIDYYHKFVIDITNPFNRGYYVYARDNDNNAIISFLSSQNENPEFVTTDNIGGLPIGKFPTFAAAKYGYVNSNATWIMYYGIGEGQNSLIETNTLTFSPSTTLNSQSYIDKDDNGGRAFVPTYLYSGANHFFISGEELISYKEGILYRPAKLGNCKLASWGHTLAALANSSLIVFDKVSHRFLFLGYLEDDPLNGVVGDISTYDKIIDFEGSDLTGPDEMIVYGAPDGWDPVLKAITRDATGLNFYTFTFDENYANPVLTRDAHFVVSGVNDKTQAILNGKTWYILAGNKIYKSPILLPEMTLVKEIPTELGEVKAFNVCKNGDQIIVATYLPDSPEDLKGSVYFLNAETGEILTPGYPNVTGEAVTILNTDYDAF